MFVVENRSAIRNTAGFPLDPEQPEWPSSQSMLMFVGLVSLIPRQWVLRPIYPMYLEEHILLTICDLDASHRLKALAITGGVEGLSAPGVSRHLRTTTRLKSALYEKSSVQT